MRRLLAIVMTLLGADAVAAGGDESSALSAPRARPPAWVLELPDTVTDVLIAETDTATMRRYMRAGDRVIEVDQRYMSIGTNGPGKERAWDRRTPLGIYFITERLDTTKLHDKYGVAAFPLDYPNAWDRYNERTGYGIWLHGVDHKDPERPPLDTDGCLALPNEEILKIADRLQPLTTPVIVARRMRWTPPADLETLRASFHVALENWRSRFAAGDILGYLSLYADDFRYRDMNRDDWATYRYQVFANRPLEAVEIDDILLLADPEEPDLYLSRFTQRLVSATGTTTTTRRLYWRRTPQMGWQIVSEDAG